MVKYTEKACLSFLKDPTTERKAAAGGKMLFMNIVRGQ
jgi:hypothetical protein